MGCGGSKPEESADGASAEDVGLAPKPQKRMSLTKRRVAVRAETEDPYDPETDKPEEIPKSPEEKAVILKALGKSDIFSHCTPEQFQFLAGQAMALGNEEGDIIIQQGENGDHFYIVASGSYVASLAQKNNEIVATYGEADSFGELALLYNAPRAATVTCAKAGTVYAIERKKFRYVMLKTGKDVLGRLSDFLKSVSLLSELTDAQRGTLADKLETIKLEDAEYVVSTGDIADAMFFVKEGELVATVGEEKKEVVRYKTGDYFGESCLEPTAETAVRKANVVAVGNATVLKLAASSFREQLGSLGDVVSKNFKRRVLAVLSIDNTMVFDTLDVDVQESVLDTMQEKAFEKGAEVISQGKPNTTFYIIKGGSAKIMQSGGAAGEGQSRMLSELKNGEYFGERGLLFGEASLAGVYAGDSGLTVYFLDKSTEGAQPLIEAMSAALARVAKKREIEANKPDLPKFQDLELRRILGVGTFGRVKLVIHKPSNVTYALKCMRKAQVVATKQQSHVLNEKNILAMMEHPFILALVNTYQDAGELYMLLELALGGELFTLLAKRAPLFDAPARFYVANVVSMFSYMHSMRVIYRDLKPENLLLDKTGYLKLVDFGFAKILSDRTWTLCGTPEYLAPEIILNKGHGFGADWWCVGILAFECLTGTTPFVSNDPMEGYRKIIKCRVPWPVSLTVLTKDFIDRLLQVDPSRRLGCLKGGPKDVRSHPWFAQLDFKKLEAKEIPAPYVPKIKDSFDDSNFDTYTDEGKLNYPQEDFPKEMFKEFATEWV